MSNPYTIRKLGEPRVPAPLKLLEAGEHVVRDAERVAYHLELNEPTDGNTHQTPRVLEKAGPRELLFFAPRRVRAAIVTCGGLCPGLNDVIRSLVMTLWKHYGVRQIVGVRYGYRGLLPDAPWEPMP